MLGKSFPGNPQHCVSGVSREARTPTDCRPVGDFIGVGFAAYAAPTNTDSGFVGNAHAEHGSALQVAQPRLQGRDCRQAGGLRAQDARTQLQALEACLAQLQTVTR